MLLQSGHSSLLLASGTAGQPGASCACASFASLLQNYAKPSNVNPKPSATFPFVQASTNTLLSHFVSLFFSLWLSRIISRGAGQPSSQVPAFS